MPSHTCVFTVMPTHTHTLRRPHKITIIIIIMLPEHAYSQSCKHPHAETPTRNHHSYSYHAHARICTVTPTHTVTIILIIAMPTHAYSQSHQNTHAETPTHNHHHYHHAHACTLTVTPTPRCPHTITCCRWQGPGCGRWRHCRPPMVAHHHDIVPVGQSPCQLMVGDGLTLPRPCQHLDAILVGPRGCGQGVEGAEVIHALRHSGGKVTRPRWSLGVCWGICHSRCRRMTGARR